MPVNTGNDAGAPRARKIKTAGLRFPAGSMGLTWFPPTVSLR